MSELLSYLAPSFEAYLSGFSLFIVLAIMGVMIGVLAGMFGVGGGFLLVPLMNIVLGIPMEIAAGSTTCYIIGTSSSGFYKQLKHRNVELSVLIPVSIGSFTGAIFGDILQDFLIYSAAGGNRVLFEEIMQGVYICILLLISAVMFFSRENKEGGKLLLQKFPLGPRVNLPVAEIEGISWPGMVLTGLLGGLLTGLLGISGGVLFVPLLMLGVGLSAHKAAGTSLGIVFFASVSAVIKKGLSGPGKISLAVALALLAASVLGVNSGIWLGRKLNTQKLRRYFAIIGVLTALMVAFRLLGWI